MKTMIGRKLAVLMGAIAALAVMLIAGQARAALSARGAPDQAHGNYPVWYQDQAGLSLELCTDDSGFCVGPEGRTFPGQPLAFPGNWPDEMFYYDTTTGAGWTINGANALVVMALEAAFSIGPVQDGDQVVFARIRVKLNNAPLTGQYTLEHPWGQFTFDCEVGVVCVFTRDIGLAPLAFDLALGGDISTFLRPSNVEGGAALAPVSDPISGNLYIANPAAETFITGGTVRNSVTVIDPLGNRFNQNRFVIMGKIIGVSVSPASAVFAPQAPGVVSEAKVFTLTNLNPAQNLVLGALSITGANPADFQSSLDSCSGATVAPGASCSFSIVMSGAAAANSLRSATAKISASAPLNTPPVAILLSGEINASMPTIVSMVPANGAADVPTNQKIIVRFSEALNPASVTNASLFLTGGIQASLALDATGKVVVLTPLQELTPNTAFTVNITSGIEDLVGNPAGAQTSVFTTGAGADLSAPAVVSTVPTDNSTGTSIEASISAVFSKDMDPTLISSATFTLNNGATGSVVYDEASKTATFTPDTPLELDTIYTAMISTGAVDLMGNSMAADYKWTFLTDVAPTVPILVAPDDAEEGIGSSVELKWMSSTDEDGDAIVYHVSVCDNDRFVGCNPIDKSAKVEVGNLKFALAGGSGLGLLLAGTFFMGGIKYKKRMIALLIAAYAAGTVIVACGSGSDIAGASEGDGVASGTESESTEVSLTVNGLKPNTFYTWKVEADDGKGGKVSSGTWQFKTAP